MNNNVTIRLTSPLRKFANGLDEVPVEARSVGEALRKLVTQYPALNGRIVNADGTLREFIHVYIGKEDAHNKGGLAAAVNGGSVISIMSPFSGG